MTKLFGTFKSCEKTRLNEFLNSPKSRKIPEQQNIYQEHNHRTTLALVKIPEEENTYETPPAIENVYNDTEAPDENAYELSPTAQEDEYEQLRSPEEENQYEALPLQEINQKMPLPAIPGEEENDYEVLPFERIKTLNPTPKNDPITYAELEIYEKSMQEQEKTYDKIIHW